MPARKKKSSKPSKTAKGKRTSASKSNARAKKTASRAKPARPKKKATSGRAAGSKGTKPAAAKKVDAKLAQKRAKAEAAKLKAEAAKLKEREQREKEKQKERERKERERERVEAQKARDKEKREKEKAREAEKRAKEQERVAKEKERERARLEKEKLKAKAEKEAERARQKKEADARRAAEKAEKEAERKRLIAEREAAKEAARRAKEEERARRDAEREAYRKAKEAERERLRAEREAARRLREGKVARATKAAQRVDGLRVGTTRVYDPAAIPNQAGTSRQGSEPGRQRLVGVRHAETQPGAAPAIQTHPPVSPHPPVAVERRPTPPPAIALPSTPDAVEQRYLKILERLVKAGDPLKSEYEETLEMSWIHHDSALEGVVYTFQELRAAMDPSPAALPDSSLQPVCEEIRRHRQAIAYVRDLGERKRVPLNVDVVKKLFVMLHPEEGDVKTVKYRKDIPQHRLYFHEYTAPDKIAYRVRQIMDWLNGPEAKKMKNPLRVAARVHYDLLRVFPFAQDSGKVARLLMNIILLRGGYPPAIVHSTERQRYYEALKGSLPIIIQLVNESIMNALASIEKRLDEHEARVAS